MNNEIIKKGPVSGTVLQQYTDTVDAAQTPEGDEYGVEQCARVVEEIRQSRVRADVAEVPIPTADVLIAQRAHLVELST